MLLDGDDGTTWRLRLPPGWSVEAEPGARVVVTGTPDAGAPVLLVRRIATA